MADYPFSFFPSEPWQDDPSSIEPVKKTGNNDSFFRNDAAFDWLYPEHLQLISLKQWTPLAVARKAAGYLALPGNILDIGSGIGKFCLTAAHLNPLSNYYGVEQRQELLHYAEVSRQYLQMDNVSFIHANITQINFDEFDHFYFYNAFYENIDRENAIDDTIEVSYALYEYYCSYLHNQLSNRPAGTRVVTYQSAGEIIPKSYKLADTAFTTLLNLWIKEY